MFDKYSLPTMQDAFKVAHEQNMAILKKFHSNQSVSLSWIYHLAHLEDFSEIFEAKKEGKVRACLKVLKDYYETQAKDLPMQRRRTERIHKKLAKGA